LTRRLNLGLGLGLGYVGGGAALAWPCELLTIAAKSPGA